MEFREHDAEDKLTKIAPVEYMPNAKSDRFDSFIREIMSGDMSIAPMITGMEFTFSPTEAITIATNRM